MKERIQHVAPIINGVVILATGFGALDEGRPFGYAYIACALVYVILVILTLRRYIHQERIADLAATLALTLAAVDFYLQGRKGLPFAYLTGAILSSFLPAWGRKRRERKEAERRTANES